MGQKFSPSFSKVFLNYMVCFLTLFILTSSMFSMQGAEIREKRNDFQDLPSRPLLKIKKKPEMTKEDFLKLDSEEVSKDEFFTKVAFIGDSVTQGLTMLPAFQGLPFMAELGLSLGQAQIRASSWSPEEAEVIFILLGINDMTYYFMDAELYARHYEELLDVLDQLFPQTQKVVQGIFPVTASYSHPSINNDQINKFNEALKFLAQERDILYVNVGELFSLEDGSLDPNLTFDGLHIYYQCYGSWLAKLHYSYEFS